MKGNGAGSRILSGAALPLKILFLSLILLSFTSFSASAKKAEDVEYAAPTIENEMPAYHNVTLLISDWDEESHLQGLNVSIYDLNGSLILNGISDDAGRLNAKLKEGLYLVVVRSDDRIVGRQEVHVNASRIFLIKTWAYTLKVTCVDQEDNPLPNVIALLYSRAKPPTNLNVNGSWQLAASDKTDEDGVAAFDDVWNGTYRIVIEGGRVIGEKAINVTKSEHITIRCNKTFLEVRVVTSTLTERPLPNASVLLQDSSGHPFLRGCTDEEGYVRFNSVYADNYSVFVDWMGMEVFSGVVNTEVTKKLEVKASVFEVSLRIVGPDGNPLPHSKVVLEKVSGRIASKILESKADEGGFIYFLLPSGTYKISCFQGIYSGEVTVNLVGNVSRVVRCSIHLNVWVLLFLISLPLSLMSLLLERNKLRKPLEYKRYRKMLSKLESMYSNGLVEYKIYRKLREEYEAKLMELGGRRWR